jgi:hypothetical protein
MVSPPGNFAPEKEKLPVRKTERQKASLFWKPSSAGFTAKSHLLSLERSDIIAKGWWIVKHYFDDLTFSLASV